jgi:hypothetical protein
MRPTHGWKLILLAALLWPPYQIIGTARHELSHALVAWWQGATVTEVHIFPGRIGSQFYWGWTSWYGGHGTWIEMAAPYFCDALTAVVFFGICFLIVSRNYWVWFHCWVFGLWSPLLNSAWNYYKVLSPHPRGDVEYLLTVFPQVAVHAWFIVNLALYLFGIVTASRYRRIADESPGQR